MEGKWDSFIKNIGVLTVVATLVGSAVAFFIQRYDIIQQGEIQAKARERESKLVFLEKQAELYFEIVPLVSKLANIKSPRLIDKKDESRFWQIFWGELGMVEDANVARAMNFFGKSLNAFKKQIENEQQCAEYRKAISLTLSHCVRKSLGDNWGVQLEDLSINRCKDDVFAELQGVCLPKDKGESTRATK